MKTLTKILLTFFLTISCLLSPTYSFSQGTWTQKTAFGGTARWYASGFCINTKGYIGTGYGNGYKRDFWEWDQNTNAWTQKAVFGGTIRAGIAAFSIGTKGYIGTGEDASVRYKDFWEWDQATDTWTQKAVFGGTARRTAVSFSIGNKGYIGTGWDGTACKQDFWEWNGDPASSTYNTWTQKASFGGAARLGAAGFVIGTKAYIGTGISGTPSNYTYYNDLWEWDQTINSWAAKTNFPGAARHSATGFSIANKGYLGTGSAGSTSITRYQDFWEYNPVTDTWAQCTNFGGSARQGAVGFSIGTKGYIGTGEDPGYKQDFWEYDPNGITSVSESSIETAVSVFPNPFSTQVAFNLREEVNDASLFIYDLSGKEVNQINFSGKQIIVQRENFSLGTYLYKIISEGKNIQIAIGTGKLIIQK